MTTGLMLAESRDESVVHELVQSNKSFNYTN